MYTFDGMSDLSIKPNGPQNQATIDAKDEQFYRIQVKDMLNTLRHGSPEEKMSTIAFIQNCHRDGYLSDRIPSLAVMQNAALDIAYQKSANMSHRIDAATFLRKTGWYMAEGAYESIIEDVSKDIDCIPLMEFCSLLIALSIYPGQHSYVLQKAEDLRQKGYSERIINASISMINDPKTKEKYTSYNN